MCVYAKSLQSCLILCNPMNHSLPGSAVHGIPQARILEWVAISFSRGSSWSWIPTCVSYISCNGSWEAPQPCVCVCVCVCILFQILFHYRLLQDSWTYFPVLCCLSVKILHYLPLLPFIQIYLLPPSFEQSFTVEKVLSHTGSHLGFAIKPMRWLNSPIFQTKKLRLPG